MLLTHRTPDVQKGTKPLCRFKCVTLRVHDFNVIKLVRAKVPGKIVRYTAPDTELVFKITDPPGREK